MPLGSPNLFNAQASTAANVGTFVGGQAQLQAAVPSPTGAGGLAPTARAAPVALGIVILLYLFWAIIVRHEKLNAQFQPANVAVNLHNILVVGLTAMLFILIGQILFIKLTILKVPGASTLARLFAAV